MKAIKFDQKLYDYFLKVGVREQPILQKIREFGFQHPQSRMLSTPDSAQLLQMLVRLTQAKNILEIGTFFGYSAAAMALALPEDGKIICCELETEYAEIAEKFWRAGNLADKIECRIGDALATLKTLPKNFYDLIFIDADKSGYDHYYEQSLQLVRTGGVIVLDNMLLMGRVVDETENTERTQVIRRLNEKLKNDPRVDILMLTVGDGMTVVYKK